MNLYSLLLFTSFIIFIYLGVTVLGKKARSRLTVIFCILCFAFAYWSLCITFLFPAPTREAAFFWIKVSSPAWALIPALFLHFTLLLTERVQAYRYNPAHYLIYLPGLLFAWREITSQLTVIDFSLESYGWNGLPPMNSNWFHAFNAYYLGFVLLAVFFLVKWRNRSASRRQKKQANIVIITVLTTVALTFLNETMLPFWGITRFPKIPSFLTLIWAFGMWYAISRYRLMELTPALASDEILDNIQDMLLLTDSQGKIAHLNNQVELILGYPMGALMEKPVFTLFPETEAARLKEVFQQMEDGKLSSLQHELEIYTKQGSPYPFRLFATAVRDNEADLVGVALVAQDLRETRQLQQEIGERKKVEIELRQSNEKLKELDQLKTDFLSSVSHELRTPLTSILGFTSIIKKRFDNTLLPLMNTEEKKTTRAVRQVQENLDIIISEGQRLTNLINEVLDIAKMEAGRTEWKCEEIDIYQVVQKALAATRPLFQQKGLFLTTDLEAGQPPLYGDGDRLLQVFINLLSNGMKFTEEGGVNISVARHNGTNILVKIIDTGIGINPAEQDKVFEKFKQVGDTLTGKPQGTGLGLSICKEIVEHHGGQIWVESAPGQGCSFCFTLPFKDSQEETGQPQPGNQATRL